MLVRRYFWVMKSYISTEIYDPSEWHALLANIHPSWYLYHPQLMKSWSDARYSSAVKNCKVAGKVAADLLNWLVQQQLVGWSDVGRCCLQHKILTMTLLIIFSPPGTKSTSSALRWAVTRQATLADFAINFLTGGFSWFPGWKTNKRKRTKRHFTPGTILNNAKIWHRN